MNITAKNLNLLPILVAIADESNLSRASVRLNLSQPALSHALARLRDEFADPLFVRASHGLTPTPRAEKLVEQIRPLLTSLDTLYLGQSTDFSKIDRTFSLAMTTYFEMQILADLRSDLKAVAPAVKLSTVSLQGNLPRDELERGEFDLAIAAYFVDLPASLRKRVLGVDPIVCLTRKNHPYIKARKRISSYLSYEHVAISIPPGDIQNIDLALAKINEKRRVSCEVNNFLTAPLIIRSTDDIITCPKSLAESYAELYELAVSPPPLEIEAVEVKMIWHERFQQDPFHKYVRTKIAEDLWWG